MIQRILISVKLTAIHLRANARMVIAVKESMVQGHSIKFSQKLMTKSGKNLRKRRISVKKKPVVTHLPVNVHMVIVVRKQVPELFLSDVLPHHLFFNLLKSSVSMENFGKKAKLDILERTSRIHTKI